jgi:transposase-like protein
MELFTGAPGRCRWPDELKARIVLESFAPDAVVTQVAQRRGCRPQQIHDWRRLAPDGARFSADCLDDPERGRLQARRLILRSIIVASDRPFLGLLMSKHQY